MTETNKAFKLKKTGITVFLTGNESFTQGLVQVTKTPGSGCVFSVNPDDLEELAIENPESVSVSERLSQPYLVTASKFEISRRMEKAWSEGKAFASQKVGRSQYRVMEVAI